MSQPVFPARRQMHIAHQALLILWQQRTDFFDFTHCSAGCAVHLKDPTITACL